MMMVKEIMITLLWNPMSTQNSYWHTTKRRYMKTEAKQLKESYIYQVRSQKENWELYSWPVSVIISLYFANNLRRDRDNRHKLSMDALEWIILKDDSQIQEAHVYKLLDKGNPRIEIIIKKLLQ